MRIRLHRCSCIRTDETPDPHHTRRDGGNSTSSEGPLRLAIPAVVAGGESHSACVVRATRHRALQKAGSLGSAPRRVAGEPCSAASHAQLTEPASVVRLHPFLRESSLVVISEDVDELEHDPVAIRGNAADG